MSDSGFSSQLPSNPSPNEGPILEWGPAYEPVSQASAAARRMKDDSEVARLKRKLLLGFILVVLAIALTLWSKMPMPTPAGEPTPSTQAEK